MLQLHKSSGSARTAFENIHYFKMRGYEVHLAAMTMDRATLLQEGAILHQVIPWIKSTGKFRRIWFNWQINRLRKKLKPEITVGHGDIEEQDVLTLHNSVFLASELIHGTPLSPKSEMFSIHGDLLKKQKFKKLIANSKLMRDDCVKRFKIPAEKIHVVYPALDTNTFFPKPEEKQTLRKRFGFDERIVVALVTSGNFKKRGLDIFAEAIESLPAEVRAKATFRVIGKDTAKTSPLITFDPGISDIENYYRAIDVFVLPARIEEFGRVVLEAMGCGLPVITTDKVGAGELLSGESAKYIVPSHDPKSLAKAISELILDSSLRERLGKLNTELARANSEELVYEKFDQVFSNL
jgi:UDP-glucose:(heptosyl)LPS alpha-1,3-glucosyltransferase